MKFSYDNNVDSLYIQFQKDDVIESEELMPGVVLNIDRDGNVVGIEISDASAKLGCKPDSVVEL